MRTIVYYLRLDQPYFNKETNEVKLTKVPYATITLIEEGGVFSRGVSICAPEDIFNKKTGRKISYNRAEAGFKTRKKLEPINLERTYLTEKFNYKIEYSPELTVFEKKLLAGPKET